MKTYELKELTLDELKMRLEDAQAELANLRIQKSIGQLDNPLRIRIVRREIAQLKTVIHEYELGLRKPQGEIQVEE